MERIVHGSGSSLWREGQKNKELKEIAGVRGRAKKKKEKTEMLYEDISVST